MAPLILSDSSVLINIFATNNAEEILRSFTYGVGICTAVQAETLYLRSDEPGRPPVPIILEPLLLTGALQVIKMETEAESTLYVDLAADLDDGEAMTLAIAPHRGFLAATDDRKARRVAVERLGLNGLLRTSDLIYRWATRANPTPEVVGRMLRRVQDVARFQPPNDDPLGDWWNTTLL
jgi:predicted nucleic acid-binding protein